jgi:hypothetical protein
MERTSIEIVLWDLGRRVRTAAANDADAKADGNTLRSPSHGIQVHNMDRQARRVAAEAWAGGVMRQARSGGAISHPVDQCEGPSSSQFNSIPAALGVYSNHLGRHIRVTTDYSAEVTKRERLESFGHSGHREMPMYLKLRLT